MEKKRDYSGIMERIFHLKERKSSIKQECIAGLTSFFAMAYILAVQPVIMSAAGMDRGAVFTSTCAASMFACITMGFAANYPFTLAPAMGMNAFFVYTAVINMGYSWHEATAAIFAEGVIFLIMTVLKLRTAIFNAVPACIKNALSASIGLFIAFTGLKSSNIVINDPNNLVGIFDFKQSLSGFTDGQFAGGGFSDVGITVIISGLGILITLILLANNVKQSILIGILSTWVLGIICELTGLYIPNPHVGMTSVIPDFSNGLAVRSMAPVFMKMNFKNMLSLRFLMLLVPFLSIDMLDTMGALMGISAKEQILDKNGELPGLQRVLAADSICIIGGAVCGTSTVSTYAECTAGIESGGRTGLSAVVTGLLFGLSIFLSPVFLSVPPFATAPALVAVGFLMLGSVAEIDFTDSKSAVPAYVCLVVVAFMGSIGDGIALSIIAYVLVNTLCSRNRKKLSPVMWVLLVLFMLKYAIL